MNAEITASHITAVMKMAAMDKVAIPIREFIDFLDFEIEKVQLAITRRSGRAS